MPSTERSSVNRLHGFFFAGAIILYFIIALEVLIMISPFAAYFDAALKSGPPLPRRKNLWK